MTKDDLLVFVRWLKEFNIALVNAYGDGDDEYEVTYPLDLDYILERFLEAQREASD